MTVLYVDADACPVRSEVERVAARLAVRTVLVANGSRPLRPSTSPLVEIVLVPAGADVADDWIAERVTGRDVCATADIPLAARCLAKHARALSFRGREWTGDNIGSALAGRAIGQHLRESGVDTGGPPGFAARDRQSFLETLDRLLQAARRGPPPVLRWRPPDVG